MITLTILILLIVLIVYLDKKSNYEDTSYFQDTHKSYGEATGSKGNYGEYLIYKELRQFEADGAKFIYNCYLPTANPNHALSTKDYCDVCLIHEQKILGSGNCGSVLTKENIRTIFGNRVLLDEQGDNIKYDLEDHMA